MPLSCPEKTINFGEFVYKNDSIKYVNVKKVYVRQIDTISSVP